MLNVDHIVTGHNADDIAETVLMNSKLQSLVVFTSGRIGRVRKLACLSIANHHTII